MKTEEEVQKMSDELADRFEESEGRDNDAWIKRMALDWVLEEIGEI